MLLFFFQVLTDAQQSKEQSKIEQDRFEKRIQEFRTQSELDSQQVEPSNVDGNHVYRTIPYKNVEATSISTADKEVSVSNTHAVINCKRDIKNFDESFDDESYIGFSFVLMQVIKQGYLLKRSASLRADWKRRFFVLDNHGSLYYYRNTGNKSAVCVPRSFLLSCLSNKSFSHVFSS